MESSSSSPETPEILRDVSHQENLEEQCQELLKSSENREEKPKKRNDTPWPKETESKIQSLTGLSGSIIKSEGGKIGSDDVVFLTPQHLDFSIFSSSDISLNLSTVQSASRDVPPNTPNISNLDEELAKEGKKQEKNLKEHLENVAQNPNLKISAKAKKSTPKHLNFSNLTSPSSTTNKVSSNTPILANLANLAEKISPKESLDFSIQSTSSMGEIEVPPNTPTSANLEPNIAQKTPSFADIENELIKEAKKLEGNLKETVEKNSAKKPVEAVKEKTVRTTIAPYTRNVNEKEKDRRKRNRKGIDALKNLVPGLTTKSSDDVVCEMTVKYVKFMKTQVEIEEVDKEFLMGQIF